VVREIAEHSNVVSIIWNLWPSSLALDGGTASAASWKDEEETVGILYAGWGVGVE